MSVRHHSGVHRRAGPEDSADRAATGRPVRAASRTSGPGGPHDIHTGSTTGVPISRRRRGFVNWLLGTSARGIPALGPLSGRTVPGAAAASENRRAASVTLPIKPERRQAEHRSDLQVRQPTGDPRSGRRPGSFGPIRPMCTHLNCTVQYRADLESHLVRVPQRAFRSQRPEHRGAPAAAAGGVRRQRARQPDRGEQERLRMAVRRSLEGDSWTWLDSASRPGRHHEARPEETGARAPSRDLVLLRRDDALPLRRPGRHGHPAAASTTVRAPRRRTSRSSS